MAVEAFAYCFPEVALTREAYGYISHLDLACNRVAHLLVDAHPQRILCQRGQDQIANLSEFVTIICDVLSAFYRIMDGIQGFITSDLDASGTLSAIHTDYLVLVQDLCGADDLGRRTLEALSCFDIYLTKELSDPSIIHSFVGRILGPTPAEVTLSRVLPVIQAIRTDVNSIVTLARRLLEHARELRARFSIATLLEIRDMAETSRGEVGLMVKHVAWEFYAHARSARETAHYIRRLAVPVPP